jgi:hypothetical protein
MREFPSAEDLKFLIGYTPTQFTVNRGQLNLLFEGSCLIVMEHQVSFVDIDGRRMEHVLADGYQPDAIEFHKILGSPINGIQRDPFILTLEFENGTKFEIHSVEGPYESGTIGFHHPNGEGDLIVF